MKRSSSEQDVRDKVVSRISRIEGQLKGIRKMLQGDTECLDVITQVLAVRSAISVLGIELLKEDMLCHAKDKKTIDEAYIKTLFSLK